MAIQFAKTLLLYKSERDSIRGPLKLRANVEQKQMYYIEFIEKQYFVNCIELTSM